MFAAGDTEPAVIVRPPARNNFGDRPGPGTEIDLPGCLFEPGPSSEVNDGAAQLTVDAILYAPPGGPDVLNTDQMRVRGQLYEIVGQPQVWASEGTVIRLRRVTG